MYPQDFPLKYITLNNINKANSLAFNIVDETTTKLLNEFSTNSHKVVNITTNVEANIHDTDVSLKFCLKEMPNLETFQFSHIESIEDAYFQMPDAIFTVNNYIWSKERIITIDGKVEKRIIVKLTDPIRGDIQIELVISKHLGLDRLFRYPLDTVKITRHVYYSKEEKDALLSISSTRLPNGKYYNHGSIRSSDYQNSNKLFNLVGSIALKNSIIPSISPVIVRLLVRNPSLKSSLSKFITSDISQLSPYFTMKGIVLKDDENDSPEIPPEEEEYFTKDDIDIEELNNQFKEIEDNLNYMLGERRKNTKNY